MQSSGLSLLGRGVAVVMLTLALTPSCAPSSSGDDGGVTDAAVDVGDDDGGSDAGVDACVDLDPVLGSLAIAAGFSVVESAPLPSGIVVVRTVAEGEQRRVYGLDVAQGAVVDLGTWPIGERTPTKVFAVIPADLDDEGALLSWFLAYDGTRLASGYTGTFDSETFVAPGEVALYDLTAGVAEPLTYVPAANNYAADFVGNLLVVNAASLGDVDEGTAIYALGDEPGVLARYEDPTSTFGGPLLATSDGGLLVGGYVSATSSQHFYLLAADDLSAALAGEPIALADAEEVLAAPSLTAARFGDGVAYVHGDFFTPYEAIRKVSLAEGASRDPSDVLTFVSDCSTVDLLADLDDDLLVAIQERDAPETRRLVRIREDG